MFSRRSLLALIVSLAGLLQQAAQSQTGIITTIAGTGVRDFSGDGGPAINAALALANVRNQCDPNRFEQMTHITVDRSGNVFFADSENQRIRRITPQGVITTVAGNGQKPPTNARCEPTASSAALGDGGAATSATLYNAADVFVLPNGGLLIADQQNNRIRQVTSDGVISTVAGSGTHNFYSPGVPATSSPMDWPSSVALDASGTLYFAELHGNRVAKVGPDGRLVTVAGTGFPGYDGDNKQANLAQLFAPAGLAFDSGGNLYIADLGNHRVRKVTPAGMISTIAGNGQAAFSGDSGPATGASPNLPTDVKVDARGNIYIADMGNNRVRRIDSSGTITTIAGDGRPGRGPDGRAATDSSLFAPSGIAIDPTSSDLYILDWQNYLVRKVSFNASPAISSGGIVNAASFAPAPIPVAPGSIVTIFGVNLASSTAQAAGIPLPTDLGGASVTINGAPAPLFFASAGQINAQVPFETSPGQATAVVTTAAGVSKGETFNVAAAAVGIFQFFGTNRAIVLNQDFTINAPENPEAKGNVVVAFLTGQGMVNPAVGTGQAAPSDTLSRPLLPVGATVGGQSANVLFLGLTPGFVGLAQANIQVPAGIATGNSVAMSVSVGSAVSNSTTISVK